MATHRYHPDPDRGDPPRSVAVLYDDCERCDEHAAHPGLGLDYEHLRRLAGMTEPGTANDRKALLVMRDCIALAAKVADATGLLDDDGAGPQQV